MPWSAAGQVSRRPPRRGGGCCCRPQSSWAAPLDDASRTGRTAGNQRVLAITLSHVHERCRDNGGWSRGGRGVRSRNSACHRMHSGVMQRRDRVRPEVWSGGRRACGESGMSSRRAAYPRPSHRSAVSNRQSPNRAITVRPDRNASTNGCLSGPYSDPPTAQSTTPEKRVPAR